MQIKNLTYMALLTGILAFVASPAMAQGNFLPGGGIQMGASGPVASFGPPTTGSMVTGQTSQGFSVSPGGPSFGFTTDSGSRTAGMPVGPQGQGSGMPTYGSGGGGVGTSQGDHGDYGRQSQTTVGNYYGNNQPTFYNQTRQPNGAPALTVTQSQSLLSNGSGGPGGLIGALGGIAGVPIPSTDTINDIAGIFGVQPFSPTIPSGRWNYGFNGDTMMRVNQVKQALPPGTPLVGGRGWYLPMTSTSSLDINTVSP